MPKKPQAAGADLHRQEPEPEPDPQQPAGGVDPSDLDARTQQPPQQSQSGGSLPSTPNISNKTLLFIGLALVLGYFAYKQTQSGSSSGSSDSDGPSFEEPEKETGPGQPNIKRDSKDPLKADEEALDWLTGEKAQELADHYGDT